VPREGIRVASYNTHGGIGRDGHFVPKRIADVLKELDADIIALQEVDRRFGSRIAALDPAMIEAETGYRAIRFSNLPQSLGHHGNVILARKSIDVIGARPIALPHLEPRGAAVADLDCGGLKVRVVGMHLGLTRKWRRLQTQAIVSELKTLEARLPAILMGDLNEPGLRSDVLRAFEQGHSIAACGPSFHASMPVVALDRIIVTEDIAIAEAGVHRSMLAREASDHLPIWAKLRLPS
jgi:endonuclease/exonuclease/phosphatase family metal-dependent hydrolase